MTLEMHKYLIHVGRNMICQNQLNVLQIALQQT